MIGLSFNDMGLRPRKSWRLFQPFLPLPQLDRRISDDALLRWHNIRTPEEKAAIFNEKWGIA